ncbi:MAG: type I restriction enzyme HsdR N-terminal domain-containing protein [Chloroflexi bacterium]|nr:type I restriction enzyme HsdR N-terminal domain-containing protein [Chloroflexota bacterium]
MILESLLELVETLKARIDTHGDKLRQSEWLTRYALIDPLLRELGWDTEDPSLVIPEYQSGHRRADYALLGDSKPLIMLEAKKLGTPLRDSVLSQGIQYCLEEGTKHFSVTDGQSWEVYETHKPVPIEQKRVVEFDLKDLSPTEVCLKALALLRPSVQSGHVIPGHESVVGSTEDPPVAPKPPVTDDPPPPPPPPDSERLTEITQATGRKVAEMVFPDGSRTLLKNWSYLPVEAVRWLMTKGMLSASDCPIMRSGSRSSQYIVHTHHFHRDGTPFRRHSEVNGLYVERFGNSISLLDRTKFVLEHFDQDPAQFGIRFA